MSINGARNRTRQLIGKDLCDGPEFGFVEPFFGINDAGLTYWPLSITALPSIVAINGHVLGCLAVA